MFHRAWHATVFGCALFIGTAATVVAGEPTNRELLPTEALAVLEVSRPVGVATHPLVREIVPLMYQSEGYRQALASPQAVQTRDVLDALKERWGTDLLEGFDTISAGGIAVSLQPGPPPRICIVVTAKDSPSLARFVEVGQQLVREVAASNGNNAPFEARSDEGRAYTRVGDAFYAVAGKRLLLANQEDELRRMLKAAGSGEAPIPSSNGTGARLTVDLRKVRENPKIAEGLEIPTKNFGLLNLVGGWVDLLRRSDTAVAELRLPEDRVELSLRFPVGSEGATPGLAALAGISGKQGSLPLLRPAGVLYSGGIYRDFGGLWNAREQLATPEHLKQLNEGASTFSKQNADLKLDELLGWIGPHFRFVACPQTRDAYTIKPADRLPAFAMALDLRDPRQFEDKMLPRLQFVGGLISVGAKMLSQTVEYGGTKLYVLRFSEDAGSLATADRLRFNFEPTYAISRKHVIIGSTSDIVRQVIDEIDRQGEAGLASLPANELQRLSGKALGVALRQIREGFIRQGVLQDGLTIPGAERELDTLVQVLETLGEATVTSTSSERETEYLLRVGKNLP